MAFVSEEQDQNKQNQTQQVQQPPPPTTSSAPGAGPGSSAGKAAPQATPSQPFQNLSAYLTANQPQVMTQANQIAGNLTGQYGQITNDINQGKTDFGNQVSQGYTAANQDVVNQAATNPTVFVSNPSNVAAFQSLYNDQYTGPQNYESTTGYGNVSGEVNKGINQASLVQTPAGLQTYLQGQNPNTTAGGTLLDRVLLQGTPEAFTTIKNAATPYNNLNDYLSQAVTEADTGVTNAKNTASGIASGIQNQFTGEGGVIPTFGTALQGNVTQAQQQALQRNQAVKDLLNNPSGATPTDQQLKDLGLTAADWSQLQTNNDILNSYKTPIFGQPWNPYQGSFNLSSYLQSLNPEAAITQTNLSTPEDYAKAAALQKLTGQDLTNILNPGDISQAGTANLDVSNFSPNAGTDLTGLVKTEDFTAAKAMAGASNMTDDQFLAGKLVPGTPLNNMIVNYQMNGLSTEPRLRFAQQALIRQGLLDSGKVGALT